MAKPKSVDGEQFSKTPRGRAVKKAPKPKVGGKKRGGATKGTRRGNGGGGKTAGGAGWGGEAKGAGKGKRDPLAGQPGPGRGHFSVAGEARAEATRRRTEVLYALLWDIATDPEEMTPCRIQATNHLLNRIEGMPVQTVVNATPDDLTDDERASQLAAFRNSVVGSALPERPHGVGDPIARPDAPDAG